MDNRVHPILASLVPIADAIGQVLGDSCEVVIHDLHRPTRSIFHIVHGEITGRKVGDALGSMFDDLSALEKRDPNSLINYYLVMNNHPLKSSKILIRDENNSLVGCFCINIMLEDYFKAKSLIDKMCETNPAQKDSPENVTMLASEANNINIDELVSEIIRNTYEEMVQEKTTLSQQDRINMIRFFEEKGIFRVKGSIEMVAELFGVTKFSIYNYLGKIND